MRATLYRILLLLVCLSPLSPSLAQIQRPTGGFSPLSGANDDGSHWKDGTEEDDDAKQKTDVPVGLYVWQIEVWVFIHKGGKLLSLTIFTTKKTQ